MDVAQQLQTIMRQTFDNSNIVISDEMTAADVEEWDSLSHIELIVNIEAAFNISLSVEDIIGLKNVGDMVRLLESRLNH